MPDTHPKSTVGTLSVSLLPHTHTLLAGIAFTSALLVGCLFSYTKIVQNEYYGYPEEWFPSLSATIGDRYPARSVFQILIALASFPHFGMIFGNYVHHRYQLPNSFLPVVVFLTGMIRTFACGMWVYITSTDDHFVHDVGMIVYLVASLPYFVASVMIGGRVGKGDVREKAQQWRKWLFFAFMGNVAPLVYFYIQHKVHHIAGAYSIYALFEWAFVVFDVAFDGCAAADLSRLQIRVVDLGDIEGRRQPLWRFHVHSNALHMRHDSTMVSTSDEEMVRGNGHTVGVKKTAAVSYTEWVHFGATVVTGCAFWTLVTGLPAVIWYFPLWNMGLSGHEAFLFSNYAPALILGLPYLGRRVPTGPFHLIAACGLLAFLWKDPVKRLMVSAFGTMGTSIAWFQMFRGENARLDRDIYGWLMGLVLHMIVKAAWRGNNPFWPVMKAESGGANAIGFGMALISALVLVVFNGKKATEASKTSKVASDPPRGNAFLAAMGLGALMYNLQCLFVDSTTVLRWSVDGYPGNWLQPVPWGVVTILAALVGIAISYRGVSVSLPFHVLGSVAAFGMYYLPGVYGAIAGWSLAVYVFAVTPSFLHAVAAAPVGRTLILGLFYWNFLMLANVWTVAYEFVPLGEYLRERSDIVIGWTVFGMLLGAINAATVRKHASTTSLGEFPATRRRFRTLILNKVIVLSALASMVVYAYRFTHIQNTQPPAPTLVRDKVFTAGIWTIHFGLDNDMWVSEHRMRKVIQDMDLDVVGLLESDVQRIITGNRDLTQSLGEPLGYYTDYGPGPSKHTWGCTLLSRFPILNSTHHLLPSPVGELACAIHATLLVHGKEIDVIVSHNGQEENPEDRFQQTTELARLLRETHHRPTVFLGYVVTKPHDHLYDILIKDGKMWDVDKDDMDRWCEYILFRGVKRLGYTRLSHGTITDTELQMGRFQLMNQDVAATSVGRLVDQRDIPERFQFPVAYAQPGLNGHYYQYGPLAYSYDE